MSRVIVLTGGVGGAKLVLGLARVLPPGALTVIVNTGDDFEHLGLYVCPDLDTTLYTLAGLENREHGWGLDQETWRFMSDLAAAGGETWFRIGDRDLELHRLRTARLAAGARLTEVTAELRRSMSVASTVLPMCDAPIRTMLDSAAGELSFQHYFVRDRCEPVVHRIRFEGAPGAVPSPEAAAAFSAPDLEAIVIAPSNPYLSIDPMLAIPALRRQLATARVPRVAVSPLIAGRAVKGPTDKLMRELGVPRTNESIAAHYQGLIDGLVVNADDCAEAASACVSLLATDTMMSTLEDKRRLARETLEFGESIGSRRARGPS